METTIVPFAGQDAADAAAGDVGADLLKRVAPLAAEGDSQGDLFLREEVAQTIAADGLRQAQVGRESGVPASTLNQWLKGNYAGDNSAIDAKLRLWIDQRKRQSDGAALLPKVPEFCRTPTAEKIVGACAMAQMMGDLTAVYGGPGVGKTTALRHYRKTRPNVWIATMAPDCSAVVTALQEIADAVGLRDTARGGGARALAREIRKRLEETKGLLAIDEAQHLSFQALEEVRSIHDATGVGVALIGNETVYSRLTGGSRRTEFAQLFSRIGIRLSLKRPVQGDVDALAQAWGVQGRDETAFLRTISQKAGALRGVTKTCLLARMAAGEEALTLKRLQDAWANLGAAE